MTHIYMIGCDDCGEARDTNDKFDLPEFWKKGKSKRIYCPICVKKHKMAILDLGGDTKIYGVLGER